MVFEVCAVTDRACTHSTNPLDGKALGQLFQEWNHYPQHRAYQDTPPLY